MGAWFMAEGLGNLIAGFLAAYSDVIRAGRFYSIFVAIAVVSAIGLMAMVPLLKWLTADRNDPLTGLQAT